MLVNISGTDENNDRETNKGTDEGADKGAIYPVEKIVRMTEVTIIDVVITVLKLSSLLIKSPDMEYLF